MMAPSICKCLDYTPRSGNFVTINIHLKLRRKSDLSNDMAVKHKTEFFFSSLLPCQVYKFEVFLVCYPVAIGLFVRFNFLSIKECYGMEHGGKMARYICTIATFV